MRLVYVAVVLSLAGCERKKSEGLPPASDWNAKAAVDLPPTDPHAGVDQPTAPDDVDTTGPVPNDDVHRGVTGKGLPPASDWNAKPDDTAGPVPNDDVHRGLGNGQGMDKLGLPPPDPNRVIDPSHRIAGVIAVDPKVADKLTDQLPVFLSVKRFDADGKPVGMPIAAQKLTWTKAGMAFEITERDAMAATGDALTGEVVVIAHYDHDGDAISKTPGDVLGQARVKIPADKVTLTLDTVVP
jgi:hypothetical protein